MYPQTGVPRSSSITTTSTPRDPPSSSQPVTSPSHPYALYQQNGLPVADDDSAVESAPAIPIGFPGRNADFHRQLGPDGEEQYIIGPDGHAEQLPPYSKYPDENEKVYAARAVPTPTSPTPSHESQSTLVQPRPQSQQLSEERAPSENAASGTTIAASEKSWQEKNWKEKRKTKICGIPFWLILVAMGCLVFVSVVSGGVIGGFLARQRAEKYDHSDRVWHHHDPWNETNTASRASHHSNSNNSTTMIDATSIPTPTGLPSFPTGAFVLPLGEPQEADQGCLTNPTQVPAWSCNIPPPSLLIDAETAPGGPTVAQIYPPPIPPTVQKYQYGAQPPTVLLQKLAFVEDLSDPQLGPALHFQTTYDKLVVLDPSTFTPPSKRKRQGFPTGPTDSFGVFEPSGTFTEAPAGSTPPPPPPLGGFHHRKSTVQVGDQPWFCFFNSTFIEGFIYVTQQIQMNNSSGSSASTTTMNGSGSHPTSSSNNGQGNSDFSTPTSTTLSTSITPNALITSYPEQVTSFPVTTSSSVTVRDAKRDNHNNNNSNKNNNNDNDNDNDDDNNKDADIVPQFPLLVKLAERRLPHPPTNPYCQKMNVNPDGSISTYYVNGQPVIIKLTEQDPTEAAFESAATTPLKSSVAPTQTISTNSMIKRGFIQRDVGSGVEEGWKAEERDIEERMAEEAVDEWKLLDEVYWKREDPTKACACQWMIT